MGAVSAVLYFLSQHPFLALPLYPLTAFMIGALLTRLTGWSGWLFLGIPGFVLGALSPFFGSAVNAIFLNAAGTVGSAVIVHSEETSSTLNDNPIWYYEAVVRTADGRDVETSFDTMSASIYPWRNQILIPPEGERFTVKYVPGFPRNIAIMVDRSSYGRKHQIEEDRAPVETAAAKLAAAPDNAEFRDEYRRALTAFITQHGDDDDPRLLADYRARLAALRDTPQQ
ncbi:hypothetical protein G4G27_19585 [Sphingomonas sp. So64.6b]|uniref:hypothetical protein n=1 Tax=Sphingomonas sp. So64.6b TaxID=2997354 RepID=UPI0015FFC099|nr:hypothetical protein [Sphingomonas sp. So64.6b]QNA85935.1 hypothetical protein G4G27_19585 [Sphingomonas sp. So64.6b]